MKRLLSSVLVSVMILPTTVPQAGEETKSNSRLKIFVSDLHLGVGNYGNEWHPTEDFRWAAEFNEFLQFISDRGNRRVDLVLLGDIFELWQSRDMVCEREDRRVSCTVLDCAADRGPADGCTPDEAVGRMTRILQSHDATMENLARFATEGANRVYFVPGNHDAALLDPKVCNLVRHSIGVPDDRAIFESRGYWVSDDGKIVADHGHQFDKVNRYPDWPRIISPEVPFIFRPTGEQLVQTFYNQYEVQFPAIDNLSGERLGLKLGVEALGGEGARDATARFFRFLLFQTSWRQKGVWLGDKEACEPEWNLDAVRKKTTSYLVESIDVDDPIRAYAEAAASSGILEISPSDLSDEELNDLCVAREELIYSYKQRPKFEHRLESCPSTNDCNSSKQLGYVIDKVLKRDTALRKKHVLSLHKREKAVDEGAAKFSLYVYGHTHSADYGGTQRLAVGWQLDWINTGTFQRVAKPDDISKIEEYWNWPKDGKATLQELRPEHLPACYSFVRVKPYEGVPMAELRYWAWDQTEKKWRDRNQCVWSPKESHAVSLRRGAAETPNP